MHKGLDVVWSVAAVALTLYKFDAVHTLMYSMSKSTEHLHRATAGGPKGLSCFLVSFCYAMECANITYLLLAKFTNRLTCVL